MRPLVQKVEYDKQSIKDNLSFPLIYLFLVTLIGSLSSCSTLIEYNKKKPRYFGGVRRNFNSLNKIDKSKKYLQFSFLIIEAPLCLTLDTILVPGVAIKDLCRQDAPDLNDIKGDIVFVQERPTQKYFRHAYIVIRENKKWKKFHVKGPGSQRWNSERTKRYRSSGFRKEAGYLNSSSPVLGIVTGKKATEAIKEIYGAIKDYRKGDPEKETKYGKKSTMEKHSKNAYFPWPGPNSNSFVDYIGRNVAHLAFELSPQAVGKDYSPYIHVGRTTTKTGIELETPVLGFQIGFNEGVELHLLQLTFGVSIFPPALKIPFIGRFGFERRIEVHSD